MSDCRVCIKVLIKKDYYFRPKQSNLSFVQDLTNVIDKVENHFGFTRPRNPFIMKLTKKYHKPNS